MSQARKESIKLPPPYIDAISMPASTAEAKGHDPAPSYQEFHSVKQAWDKLSGEERDRYQAQAESLDEENKRKLEENRQIVVKEYGFYSSSYNMSGMDLWLSSQLMQTSWSMNLHAIRMTSHAIGSGGTGGAVMPIGGSGGGHHGGCVGGDCRAVIVIGIIIAIIAAICSAVIAARYAVLKTMKSIANLDQSKKIAKTVVRLAGTFGGALAGAIKCALVGAALGSSVPIVGTVVGAIIGMCIGAGLGAVISKYAMRIFYRIKNRNTDAISKTNPEKYALSPEREKELAADRINTRYMLSALKIQKKAADEKIRKDYNQLLVEIKKVKNKGGADLTQPIRINNRLFIWMGSQNLWDEHAVILPKAALRAKQA